MAVTVEQLEAVESWEELAELYDIDAVKKSLVARLKQSVRFKAKAMEDRTILKYVKEHPDEFEDILK